MEQPDMPSDEWIASRIMSRGYSDPAEIKTHMLFWKLGWLRILQDQEITLWLLSRQ